MVSLAGNSGAYRYRRLLTVAVFKSHQVAAFFLVRTSVGMRHGQRVHFARQRHFLAFLDALCRLFIQRDGFTGRSALFRYPFDQQGTFVVARRSVRVAPCSTTLPGLLRWPL